MFSIENLKLRLIQYILSIESERELLRIRNIVGELPNDNSISNRKDEESPITDESFKPNILISNDNKPLKSFAGIWEDMPEEEFQAYLKETQKVKENMFTREIEL